MNIDLRFRKACAFGRIVWLCSVFVNGEEAACDVYLNNDCLTLELNLELALTRVCLFKDLSNDTIHELEHKLDNGDYTVKQ